MMAKEGFTPHSLTLYSCPCYKGQS